MRPARAVWGMELGVGLGCQVRLGQPLCRARMCWVMLA